MELTALRAFPPNHNAKKMGDDNDIAMMFAVDGRGQKNIAKVLIGEVLLRVAVGALLFGAYSTPTFIREVQHPDWHKYNYPVSKVSRISSFQLVLLCIGGYLVMAFSVALVVFLACCSPKFRRFYGDTHNDARYSSRRYLVKSMLQQQLRLGLAVSLSFLLTAAFTNFIKNWYGGPRPDFLSRCRPAGFDASAPKFDSLPAIPVCTGNAAEVNEGRRSFPSGHTSYSFAVFWFMGLFFYYHLLVPFASIGGWRLFSFFASLLPALYCGLSRTMDYRHHMLDVFVGSIIGSSIATGCYYAYYSERTTGIEEQPMSVSDPTEVVSHVPVGGVNYESLNTRSLSPTNHRSHKMYSDPSLCGRSTCSPSLERSSLRNSSSQSASSSVAPSAGLQTSGSRRTLDAAYLGTVVV